MTRGPATRNKETVELPTGPLKGQGVLVSTGVRTEFVPWTNVECLFLAPSDEERNRLAWRAEGYKVHPVTGDMVRGEMVVPIQAAVKQPPEEYFAERAKQQDEQQETPAGK